MLYVSGCYGLEVDHIQAAGNIFEWCSDSRFDSRLKEYFVCGGCPEAGWNC